jgi:tetratricopeptide (TPR) repeat protein
LNSREFEDGLQAIALNPKFAEAYFSRGLLKQYKLKDRAGAIQDLRVAARLDRQQGETGLLQKVIEQLRKLGATE